jgi:hypothetical protein
MAAEHVAPVVGWHATGACGPPHAQEMGSYMADLLQLDGARLCYELSEVELASRVEIRLQAGQYRVRESDLAGWLAGYSAWLAGYSAWLAGACGRVYAGRQGLAAAAGQAGRQAGRQGLAAGRVIPATAEFALKQRCCFQ